MVQIKIDHERINLFRQRVKPIRLSQQILNLIDIDITVSVLINPAKGSLVLFRREELDPYSIH
jgi:hypothetical protein